MKHMHSRVRSYGSDVMDCVDVSRKTTILLMMIGACWGIPGANPATSNGQRTGHALKTPDCHCLPPSACLLTPDLCSHAPACSDCSQLRHPSAWTAPHQLSSRSVPSLPLRSFVSEDNDIEIAEGNFLSKPEADDILMSHNMNGITKRSYGSPYADRSALNDDVTLKELYSTLQAIVHDYRGRSTAKRGYSRQISSADVNRLSEQQNGWKTYDGMFTRLPSAYKRHFTWLPDDTLHFANKRAMLSVESCGCPINDCTHNFKGCLASGRCTRCKSTLYG